MRASSALTGAYWTRLLSLAKSLAAGYKPAARPLTQRQRLFLPLYLALVFFTGNALADVATEGRIRLLGESILANPDQQLLYIQQAIAYSDNQQPQRALAVLKIARPLGPAVNTAYAKGIILYRMSEFATARSSFNEYLAAFPNHVGSLEYRARLLRDSGEFEAAIKDYKHLFRINPSANPGHYLSTARMMVTLSDGGDDAALALLDEKMAQSGVLSQLQRYAVELERNRGNYQAAITRMGTLDEALRATPQWQVEVAELTILDGQFTQAQPLLDVAEQQLGNLRTNRARIDLQAKIDRLRDKNLAPTRELR
jgi:tetratricopeptide (TPR) repeat protein